MPLNDGVVVKIVGDASQVQPAVEQAGGSIEGLQPIVEQLTAQISALTAKMSEGFMAGATGAKTLAAGLEETKLAASHAGTSIGEMSERIRLGGLSFGIFEKAFLPLVAGMAALFAVDKIAHWAESLGEAAEKTEQLAAKMGMTVSQVQALSGAATMSGTNIDVLAKGLGLMDNKAVTAAGHSSTTAKAFEAMGISANDGSTNMERLLTVADKFQGMADGPTKAALAMQLFGRSGREMIPFLNQGGEAIQQLMEKTKELGGVNEAAVEQGARLASSVNESKVAWEGLKQTLTQAFGPVLTELVDGFTALVESMHESYEAGGGVKIIFDAITEVVQGFGEIIRSIALAFSSFFSNTKSQGVDWGAVIKTVIDGIVTAFKTVIAMAVFVADGFVAVFHLMKGAAEAFLEGFTEVTGGIRIVATGLGEFMKVVGKVCYDALHLDWGSIKGDWESGMEQVRQAVDAKTKQIVGEVDDMKNKVKTDFADMMNTGKSFDSFYDQLMKPGAAPKHDNFKFKFGGGAGDAPDITNPAKEKKQPKGKDDIVAQWKQQLSDMLLDEQNWGADEAQLSLQFWESKLALTKKGSKDELQVRREINQQKLALFKEEEASELASIKQRETLQLEASKTEIEIDKMTLQSKLETIDEEEKRGQISATKAIALRNDVNRQLYALDQQDENQEYQAHLKALNDELALEHLKPAARDQINRQIEVLEKQHLDRMAILNQQFDAKVKADSDKLRDQQIADVKKATDAYTQDIAKMATLQTSFISGVKSLWGDLQQTIAGILDKILQKFVLNEAIKLGFIKTDAASTVAAKIGEAGAGGVASMAAAPFPINLTAPAFGASMAALAASYGSVAGFDVGAWNLSKDQLAVVHAGEMIIPPGLAGGMRGLFETVGNDNYRAPVNDDSSFSGGDTHLHFNGPIIGSRHAMEQWAKQNRHLFGAGTREFVRQGGNVGKYRR
jgi:hypothetical protein